MAAGRTGLGSDHKWHKKKKKVTTKKRPSNSEWSGWDADKKAFGNFFTARKRLS